MMTEELRQQVIAIKKKVDNNPRYRPTVAELGIIRSAALARESEGRRGTVALGERILAPYTGG